MDWDLFDHVDEDGTNVIKEWSTGLQKRERSKLRVKLDLLRMHGPALPTQLFAGTSEGPIRKLRIGGKVQLRPLLCQGPINADQEFTLLTGAIEKDWKLIPRTAVELAAEAREAVINDPINRRVNHEPI